MVDPLSYFSFHDWFNKDSVMCYPAVNHVHVVAAGFFLSRNLNGSLRLPYDDMSDAM